MPFVLNLLQKSDLIQTGIGACIVFTASYARFNTPQTNRSSTTAGRFHSAAFSYSAIFSSLYVACIKWPDYYRLLRSMAPAAALPGWAKNLEGPTPIIVALMVGIVLPGFLLQRADEPFRRWLERRAHIPSAKNALKDHLCNNDFKIGDQFLGRINDSLALFAVSAQKPGIEYTNDNSLTNSVIRLACLKHEVEKWGASGQGALLIHGDPDVLKTLKSRNDELAHDVRALRELEGLVKESHSNNQHSKNVAEDGRESHRLVALSNALETHVDDLKIAIKSNTKTLVADFADLAARTALKLFFRTATPSDEFRVLQIERPPITLTWDDWALVLIALLFATLAANFGTAFLELASDATVGHKVRVSVMVTIIFVAASACSVWPRRYFWGRRSRSRAWRAYLCSAVLSAIIGFLISFIFRICRMNIADAWAEQLQKWPYLLLPFVVSGALAWLLDRDVIAARSNQTLLRLSESLGLCLISVVSAFFVSKLLEQDLGRALVLLLTCAAVGAILGWIVPDRYRQYG